MMHHAENGQDQNNFSDSFVEKEFVKPSTIIMEQQNHTPKGITERTNIAVTNSTYIIQVMFNLNIGQITNYPD
jgi:hypothetical protein